MKYAKPYIRCQKCHELKPRGDFPDKPSNVTGKSGICLACRPVEPKQKPEPEPVLPSRVVYAMCAKKHRYAKQGTALAAALRSARRTELMRVYRCPVCNGWHLTHKEARAS